MKRATLIELAAYHRKQAEIFDAASRSGCMQCTEFRMASNNCERWASTVPAENVATGCDEFNFDRVPF
jgi:hypothetical protein